ncbi:ROK family protein [Anaerotignum propionicum]|uniref:Glucokinase n=1 Tax=Anaerotignum propionicum DSM 1682 TaxID=991789 RepID=A0A0X1U6M2_ANAPI|nr:ROK family protein [Anaerotignum propionicum]AMJ40584.1 glucokinase [Anaerotignum propionicum DSM 1682]SHE92426.1 glucokinase [[Clostridium] propionicum DSM 1682] [Anaerotignum propionicum DSM 1682]
MMRYYLILDIGGTKTSGALFTEDGKIVDDYVHVAPSKTFLGEEAVYQNTKDVLLHIINHFSLKKEEILGIGVGSPGPLDAEKGVIIHAPLMGWHNFPIVERLEADFGMKVMLDNDGNLGALAEVRMGVAMGLKNVIYMTVSTGCGGGIVVNGEVYRGSSSGAGEVGHMSIMPEGLKCPCGSVGCFELYASGTAINHRLKEDMKKGIQSEAFELAEFKTENLNGKVLNEAAELGDAYALEVYCKEGYYLGIGIANQFNFFNPDTIVLGGGVTKAKKFFHEALMETLKERCIQPISDSSVRYSVMNDRVVLYGAYCLIKEYTDKKQ